MIVDGVGPGRVNWIHPSGDVRVELARHPGSARSSTPSQRSGGRSHPGRASSMRSSRSDFGRRTWWWSGCTEDWARSRDTSSPSACAVSPIRNWMVGRVRAGGGTTPGRWPDGRGSTGGCRSLGDQRLHQAARRDRQGGFCDGLSAPRDLHGGRRRRASLYAAGWDPIGRSAGGHWVRPVGRARRVLRKGARLCGRKCCAARSANAEHGSSRRP